MFKGVARKAKREGRGEVESRPPTEPEDLDTLSQYFTVNMDGPQVAKKLQEIVLFNIIYYTGRRGRQNLRTMMKETFQIASDPDGCRFIYQAIKEADKNHQGNDIDPRKFTCPCADQTDQARIYDFPGSQICPVWCFEFYQSKLNKKRNDL